MAEVGYNEHRKRLREEYLKNPNHEMSDRAILELFLTYAIPRKDVKPISYALLNEFGTLENIFNSDISELTRISGLGESTAILFNLVGKINSAIEKENQEKQLYLNTSKKSAQYVMSKLKGLKHERFIVVTLDEKNKVINCHNISDGTNAHLELDMQKLLRKILNDNATYVILAHNHPNGIAQVSTEDTSTTVEILGFLRMLGVNLLDHIIVANDEAFCMSSSIDHSKFFD